MTSYSIDQVMDTLLGPNVMQGLMLIAAGVVVIHIGVYLALKFTGAFQHSDEKPKREPSSYFEDPTEPDYAPVDYVVGIGDDGELVFASEKPKNDDSP